MADFDFELPKGVAEKDLVADPSRRPNHWLHTPTGDVFSCPAGWTPKKGKSDDAPAASPVEAFIKGKNIAQIKKVATDLGLTFGDDATRESLAEQILAKQAEADGDDNDDED